MDYDGQLKPTLSKAGLVTRDMVKPGAAVVGAGTSWEGRKLLSDVNDKVNASDQATRDLADGKTNDLQKVVTSVEEANLALNFTMAMRSKLLEAYQEISRMQV